MRSLPHQFIDNVMCFVDMMDGAIAQTSYGRVVFFASDIVVCLIQQFLRAVKAAGAIQSSIDRRMIVQVLAIVNRGPFNFVDRLVNLADRVLFFFIHVMGRGQVFEMSAGVPQIGQCMEIGWMPSRFVGKAQGGAESNHQCE